MRESLIGALPSAQFVVQCWEFARLPCCRYGPVYWSAKHMMTNGTALLRCFAAFDILNGKVIGACQARHRSREFVKFLDQIKKQIGAEQEVHLILDNCRTHKSAEVQRWLKPNKRCLVR